MGTEEDSDTMGDRELETGVLPRANLNIDESQDSATRGKNLNEPMITEVYVLLLGNDSQDFTKYVEKVMSAEKCLSKTGHNVVGAFISARALETVKPSKSVTPNPEYIRMLEAHKKLSPEIAGWVHLAPANVTARNDIEFAKLMHEEISSASKTTETKCFRLLDFCAELPVTETTGNTMILTASETEYLYANNKFCEEL